MCGRYAASRDAAELADWFGAEELPRSDLPPRFNVAPTTEVYVVIDEEGSRALGVARWGLIPSWSKDASRANRMINARSESVADKPAYRAAFRRRRCLVPADGYYEWQVVPRTPKDDRPVKQPFFIHATDGGPLAMAGLYEDWQGPDGDVRSCTILTQDAVGPLARIHDRMPVFVPQDQWDRWLDSAEGDPRAVLEGILAEDREMIAGGTFLGAYPVSTRVNRPTNDDPGLLEPITISDPASGA